MTSEVLRTSRCMRDEVNLDIWLGFNVNVRIKGGLDMYHGVAKYFSINVDIGFSLGYFNVSRCLVLPTSSARGTSYVHRCHSVPGKWAASSNNELCE